MTFEQKIQALTAIGDLALRMRHPGNWYVDQDHVEMKPTPDASILESSYGNGATPEAAVLDHWAKLTRPSPWVVVCRAMAEDRRLLRWNGFMWADVTKLYEER